MLWLTDTQAIDGGFTKKACPTMRFGIRSGHFLVAVTTSPGDARRFYAYCRECEWVGDDKGSMRAAQKDGAEHPAHCPWVQAQNAPKPAHKLDSGEIALLAMRAHEARYPGSDVHSVQFRPFDDGTIAEIAASHFSATLTYRVRPDGTVELLG